MTTTLSPIPKQLPAWHAEHLAWLAANGYDTRYAVREGIEPKRANMRGADLRGADLSGAYLRGADLHRANLREANLREANLSEAYLYGADLREANLREANLREANLSEAYLYGADLREANLREANLHGACLRDADLSGADLRGADLRDADLRGATGIASIGPVGRHGRIIYAIAHDDGPRIHAGCWWGSVDDTIARIESDYCNDPACDRYAAAVRAVAGMVSP